MQHTGISHVRVARCCQPVTATAVIGLCRVGRHDAKGVQDIQLSGTHILDEHCYFESTDGMFPPSSFLDSDSGWSVKLVLLRVVSRSCVRVEVAVLGCPS